MPNAVWNITVPHSSPLVAYGDTWVRACPTSNGVENCGEGSSHDANENISDKYLQISFYGTAIYLYGEMNDGMGFTATIDSNDVAVATQGDLLFMANNLPNQPDDGDLHILKLEAKRFSADGVLKFKEAIISVDSGKPTVTANTVTHKVDDANSGIKFSKGWSREDQYMKASVDFEQTVNFEFTGSAILAYGKCSNKRNDTYAFTDAYGYFESDGMSGYDYISDTSDWSAQDNPTYVTDDCLLFWDTNLPEGKHNVSLKTDQYEVFISRFDVVTLGDSAAGNSSNSSTSNGDGGNGQSKSDDSKSGGISMGMVVGIAVAAVALVLAVALFLIFRTKRRRTSASGPASVGKFSGPMQVILDQASVQEDQGPTKYGSLTPVATTQPAGFAYPPPAVSSPQPPQQPQFVYPPPGIYRHPSTHSQNQPSQPVLSPQTSDYPSSSSSTRPGSSSTRPPSTDAGAVAGMNAAHFSGRTVLTAEGSYNYAAPSGKEQAYVGAVSRPADSAPSYVAPGPSAALAATGYVPAQPQQQVPLEQQYQSQPHAYAGQQYQPQTQQQFQPQGVYAVERYPSQPQPQPQQQYAQYSQQQQQQQYQQYTQQQSTTAAAAAAPMPPARQPTAPTQYAQYAQYQQQQGPPHLPQAAAVATAAPPRPATHATQPSTELPPPMYEETDRR
ncbi:hypothetical protein BKA62DRAFT_696485 [Auriculariales sp. MPI-PUGE-AT-0066]|nr:hypothetical protein BKA62DRAFT_696485 [Auriculariales sp. MPI-PUGE-AT-0066]